MKFDDLTSGTIWYEKFKSALILMKFDTVNS